MKFNLISKVLPLSSSIVLTHSVSPVVEKNEERIESSELPLKHFNLKSTEQTETKEK